MSSVAWGMILCWFFAPFVNEAAKSCMKEKDKSPKNTENFWKSNWTCSKRTTLVLSNIM